MHILIVTDQHPESLGGAQVAIRAQRGAFEAAGHTVSIAAPARSGARSSHEDPAYLNLPALPITRDREYGLSWPTARTDRALAQLLRGRPAVDVVHVQGDFWGGLIGLRAARGLGVPVVHTLHNNLDQGTRAVTPFAPVVFPALRVWRWLALGRVRGTVPKRARGAWRYLAELAAEAKLVTAPSQHFAEQLMREGVADQVTVTRNGVDDALVLAAREAPRAPRERPRLVWLGRMSAEKRVLEFIEAFASSGADAEVTLYGSGGLQSRVAARVRELGIEGRVSLAGAVSHAEALAAIRDADALVQTSVGFETQGLTPFEAALLGTPTVYCDQRIAADVAVTPAWVVPNASVDALAATLGEAVTELTRYLSEPDALRVPWQQAEGFLQSRQAERTIALCEAVLTNANGEHVGREPRPA